MIRILILGCVKIALCFCLFLGGGFEARAELSSADFREQVMAYSWSLKQAQANVEAADASLSIARTSLLPELALAGNYAYYMRQLNNDRQWGFYVEPSLVQTIYAGGALRSAVDEAELIKEQTICEAEFSALEIAYAADYAYWSLWSMGRFRDAVSQYVEIIESESEAIERRFNEGYTAKGDLLMIRSRLSEARYQLTSAEQNFLIARNNLNILRGVEADEAVKLQKQDVDSLCVPRRIAFEELLERRPDLEAARFAEAAARASTRSAKGAFLPQLQGGVRGGWRNYTPNVDGDTYIDGSVFVQLNVPIFHFGERNKTLRQARLVERQRELESEVLKDVIRKEENNAWISLIESRAQMSAATQALRIASENLDISTYSYKEGLVSILDLLQAQISWIQLYTNAITSQFNYEVSISAYRRAVGEI